MSDLERIRSLNRLSALLEAGADFLLGQDAYEAKALSELPLYQITRAIRDGRLQAVLSSVPKACRVEVTGTGRAPADWYGDLDRRRAMVPVGDRPLPGAPA